MTSTVRRQFLLSGAGIALGAAVPFRESISQDQDSLVWANVEDWGVEGRGWGTGEVTRNFDRLPSKAEKIVRPPVWNLSRHSAGMLVRFQTNAPEIHVRYELLNGNLAMPHMPATGVSGMDLYALDLEKNWRWAGVVMPKAKTVTAKIGQGMDGVRHAFQIYLPLYNGVEKFEIGVPKGSEFQPLAPRPEKPIVFYGTSITHGACASRPGMCHPAILGRRLDKPVLNLGFSGNGKMEPEVGALLAELDPAVYVIDCLPNMTGPEVAKRAEPLVRQLREARPDTPIVLVEDRTYDYAWIRKASRDRHELSRSALIRAMDNLVASGVKNLHYIEGADLLGKDGDGTTDGSHPNDLGFLRQAEAFEPVLKKALGA
ncbi:MAG: hypothetical protein HKN23_21245 [Verrucomicrobiales bacterium]|nr:hypothetical protein [Verrucomicrobiales bacterium]